MKKKRCTKCGEAKPVDEFNKDKSKKDGLRSWCKECVKVASKKRYDANPEKVKAQQKKHREENPEKVKAQHKKYRGANPERTWTIGTLSKHRRKGCEIQITIDELLKIAKTVKFCPICGCKLAWSSKDKSGNRGPQPNSPSLDRVDNGQIMTIDTIQIICHRCNLKKGNMNMSEMLEYCKMFVKKFGKKEKKGEKTMNKNTVYLETRDSDTLLVFVNNMQIGVYKTMDIKTNGISWLLASIKKKGSFNDDEMKDIREQMKKIAEKMYKIGKEVIEKMKIKKEERNNDKV